MKGQSGRCHATLLLVSLFVAADAFAQDKASLLVGSWRDNNSEMTYRADHAFYAKWDEGSQLWGTWRLDGDLLQKTTLRRKSEKGECCRGAVTVEKLRSIDGSSYRSFDTGGNWVAKRIPDVQVPSPGAAVPEEAPLDPIMQNARRFEAEQRLQNAEDDPRLQTKSNPLPTASGSGEVGDGWQSTKAANVAAVTALIHSMRANSQLTSAFNTCVAVHADNHLKMVATLVDQQRRTSESKSEVQWWERINTINIRRRQELGEAVCAWKAVAWANGFTSFNPSQFSPNRSLGQTGVALALEKIFTLQCRQAGDNETIFIPRSVECATKFADGANSALKNPDLNSKAFDRLALLLGMPIPPEMDVFRQMAVSGYGWSRFTEEELRLITCGPQGC